MRFKGGFAVLGLIICLAIAVPMIALGIFMAATGKGSFLIAGYNTASKEKKAQYDEKALTKFVGKVLVVLGVLTALMGIEALHGLGWFWIVWSALFLGVTVFALVYANTKNRFKK